MSIIDEIFSKVSLLSAKEKLELVDKILISLQPVNSGVDAVWDEEAKERVIAHKEGHVPTIDEETLLKKYAK